MLNLNMNKKYDDDDDDDDDDIYCLFLVAAPPGFASAPEDKKVVVGDDVTMTCRVHGVPKPQLRWKHGTTPLAGDRFVVHDSGDLEIRV